MPWITFTAAHIKEGLAVRELAIYEETAAVDFDGIIEEVAGVRIAAIAARIADQFRGIIRANPLVSALGPEGTIPSFCLPWAIAIARVSILGLNPAEEGRTDPRRDEYTDAIKGRDSLKAMSANALAVVDTATPSTLGSVYFTGSANLDF